MDTLSDKKILLSKKKVRIFVCGPTVYDHPHIGNARTYLAFDIAMRYLRYKKYDVTYIQNITDIDDKIIDRANKEKKTYTSVVREYEREYLRAMKKLGVVSVDTYARATNFIPQIIKQVTTLLKKGHAYEATDGIYFDITTFADYGKLSRRRASDAQDAVSRIDESAHKKNVGDFALWKFKKPNEPSWNAPFGAGRPGWHIEDTAISEHFFGPQYDIHGGSRDIMFPHHEAEIAQQEAASGKKPFVRVWMHTGFLLSSGKKMSKSLGNFFSIVDFLNSYHPYVLRYIVASSHYRSPIDYTPALAQSALFSLENIQHTIWRLENVSAKGRAHSFIQTRIKKTQLSFARAMEDDFNTPLALAAVWDLIGYSADNLNTLFTTEAHALSGCIIECMGVLGFSFTPKQRISASVRALIVRRERARTNKQFIQSDALREKIKALGYSVDDTPQGPFAFLTHPFSV